ncbi:CPBP family intramembrane metalloprotease [Candidatus Dependentiae bacterium]|nr:CPBP family intramembrane metalloprotease [Candidatus Dependentiae bacterium]
MEQKYWQSAGPIILSALSLLISFFILQPLAYLLDPTFNLLASRGIGKVAFVCMAIYQIILFLTTQSSQFLTQFFDRNLFFFIKEKWVAKFSIFFISFFSLHALVLFVFYQTDAIIYNPSWGSITLPLVSKTIFGLFVVFMLAWTEELIFRGTIYPYIAQFYKPLPSMLITSLIFMFVHNLRNPLALVTTEWRLGLGLFLLGFFLNQIFVITKKLYPGMGVHAGLVFVKVILRRAPFLVLVPDLRQLHTVHFLFAIAIACLLFRKKY